MLKYLGQWSSSSKVIVGTHTHKHEQSGKTAPPQPLK